MTTAVVPAAAGVAADRLADAVPDAEVCRRVVRTHARTFWVASTLLGPEKRRTAYALYAFCRVADDLVDSAPVQGTASVARQLADFARKLDACLAGRPGDAIFRELHRAVRAHHVPEAVLRELLDGVARDLHPVRYGTWDELVGYCEGVASSVGEMCTYVFGVPGGAEARMRALRYARTLGVAMQLTNILRDIGEDARRGRCYLPEEELAAFGLSPADVLKNSAIHRDERWRPFMAFQIGRARALYAAAEPGLALLAPDAARCAAACAIGYAGILGALERIGYDAINQRARLDAPRRAAVLWQAWRWRSPRAGEVRPGDGPHLSWGAASAPPTAALHAGPLAAQLGGAPPAAAAVDERVRLA
jgi:phytoene synthase